MRAVPLLVLAGCALGADGGVIQHPTGTPRGGSVALHAGLGGGGTGSGQYLGSLGFDTRVDVASGGSRWTGGASMLGGLHLPGFFLTGRIGVWRAAVSSTTEAAAVPEFELGGYVPLGERFDPKHPQFGQSSQGVTFGVREDFDSSDYFTVFVGYALFLMPGY